jgi:hypothetical protein
MGENSDDGRDQQPKRGLVRTPSTGRCVGVLICLTTHTGCDCCRIPLSPVWLQGGFLFGNIDEKGKLDDETLHEEVPLLSFAHP